ncbi:hypothetical protein AJ79_09804 [Helicocarpus griseus UAMH5409]|uniref:SUN domain-containing protein n=1 Tax=Helicocarpus griseus UAMH5409 TaxID=1447875 RepID=A0A2B7WGX9_9EURO|nr:hypothetical protein AJ79_09804 [Helicocarpus griseus UAMH5409]
MPSRKTASVRSGSRAPTSRPTQVDPAANAATATQTDQSNADLGNPSLPDVHTQQSFAYGSTKTPALPRQLEMDPFMGFAEMVDTLDDGLRQAQDRDLARVEEQTRFGRLTRSMSASIGQSMSPTPELPSRTTPTRRNASRNVGSRNTLSRQPTPDDQLLESLREASEEVEVKREDAEEASSIPPDTPTFTDTASVSWTTERFIYDNLGNPPRNINTGTRPNYYSRGPYGSRPSSSREQTTSNLRHTRGSAPTFQPPLAASRASASTAAKRTLPPVPAFDQTQRRSTSASSASPAPSSTHTPSSSSDSSPSIAAVTPARQSLPRIAKSTSGILVLFVLILSAFLGYFYRDQACAFPQGLQTKMSSYFCSPPSLTTDNSTVYSDALYKLSYRVDQRLSDMAKEVATLKEEWQRRLPQLREALSRSPAAMDPLAPPKVNFAAVGMGAVVDPYLTSPTMATSVGFVGRISQYLAKVPRGPPPVAAIQPWDGVGECWCAATRDNVAQLAILLGRAIVPEEVVIEHIPKGATLDPGSTPREMELWAQYTTRPPTAAYPPDSTPSSPPPPSSASSPHAPSSFTSSSSLGSSPPRATPHVRSPPSHPPPSQPAHHLSFSSLRDTILTTLRQVYPDEPETAYSDDALLGPSFFRVGRWQYNIDGGHHIQRFMLDAVIDMPAARVEKVVLRVKSNWGAAHTCLYRMRLHGHL